jgi:hypothetical protein
MIRNLPRLCSAVLSEQFEIFWFGILFPYNMLMRVNRFKCLLLHSLKICYTVVIGHTIPRGDEMKKSILVLTLSLSIITLALATNQTATCPQDGESAGFTGNKKADLDKPMDRSRDVCEYSHRHTTQDANGMHTETHTFWQNCGD